MCVVIFFFGTHVFGILPKNTKHGIGLTDRLADQLAYYVFGICHFEYFGIGLSVVELPSFYYEARLLRV